MPGTVVLGQVAASFLDTRTAEVIVLANSMMIRMTRTRTRWFNWST